MQYRSSVRYEKKFTSLRLVQFPFFGVCLGCLIVSAKNSKKLVHFCVDKNMRKGQLSWFILESMLWTVYKFISVVHQFDLGQFAYPIITNSLMTN
jgi:hypothetical protein